MYRMIVCLAALLAAAQAAAQTEYVTDNLRLGLHQAQDTSDRAFRTLESGQALEILSRNRNYAHVRLPDGTTGYVKAAYLVDEKPAKLIVAETAARVEQLEAELAETKEAFAVPGATIAALEQELAARETSLEAAQSEVAELTDDNDNYRRRHEQFKYSLPASWVAGAAGVCLLVGFLLGLWHIDRKSRKKHGGIRIY